MNYCVLCWGKNNSSSLECSVSNEALWPQLFVSLFSALTEFSVPPKLTHVKYCVDFKVDTYVVSWTQSWPSDSYKLDLIVKLIVSDLANRWPIDIAKHVFWGFFKRQVSVLFLLCALWFPVLFAMCWSCGNVFCQVIDEIYRVLRYVNSTRAPQRAHEVLQELRDISSMAMEYFDEKIVPILKKKLPGADLSGRLIGSAPGNGHLKQKTCLRQLSVFCSQ